MNPQKKKKLVFILVGLDTLLLGVILNYFLDIKTIGFILILLGFMITVWGALFLKAKENKSE